MYKTDNKEIGKHLADLIKNSHYKSDRQFGIAYLEQRDGTVNPDDIPKIQNRICQIKKGNKGLQIEDLPIISELLGVSIENILSAGTALVPVSNRQSNYSIAFSNNPTDWESYIEREDKLILNPDEYNKTVIDYAFEAENYPFLKYLIANKYIWFVSDNSDEYFLGFGAGTSIKRRPINSCDLLEYKLKEQDDLRFKMIALAIRNNDFKMLDELHAREIPLLYTISPIHHGALKNNQLPLSHNIKQMIKNIAISENINDISYFFDEFNIKNLYTLKPNTFVFPYAGYILDSLITYKRTSASKQFLENAILHNKKVLKKLREFVKENKNYCKTFYNNKLYDNAFFNRVVWCDYYFYPDTGFLVYRYTIPNPKKNMGFITNVINVTTDSTNSDIQILIEELRKTYNTFITYYEMKES